MLWRVEGNWNLFQKNSNKLINWIWNCHQINVIINKWLANFVNDLKWFNSLLNVADNHTKMMKNCIHIDGNFLLYSKSVTFLLPFKIGFEINFESATKTLLGNNFIRIRMSQVESRNKNNLFSNFIVIHIYFVYKNQFYYNWIMLLAY